MKTFRTLIQASAIVLFAVGAEAEEGTPDVLKTFVSTKSRAEVIAELHAASKAGLMPQYEASYQHVDAAFVSTLSRAQVRAEAIEAQRLGLMSAGEAQQRQATPAELESIRRAGLRALDVKVADKQR